MSANNDKNIEKKVVKKSSTKNNTDKNNVSKNISVTDDKTINEILGNMGKRSTNNSYDSIQKVLKNN